MEAHAERRSRHSQRFAYDHRAYTVSNDGDIAWGQHRIEGLRLSYQLETARELFETIETSSEYVDLHAWRFTPASFELLLLELAWLGKTDWRVERITDATGCEFYAWLRRGGKATAAMPDAELANRRLALLKRTLLETKAQIDWLLDGDPKAPTLPAEGEAQADSRDAGVKARVMRSRWPSVASIWRYVAQLKDRVRLADS